MSTRDFTIKTNVLKRVAKEEVFYTKEKEHQERRIAVMVEKDPEDYEIKKQREVLEETMDMFPDVERRRKAALQDLSNLVMNASPDVKGSKEYEEARKLLEASE
ncbi:hypothetical protein BGZ96_002733 [Linnemannia gamsii]|uniref:Tubulin-specific chaperone A n=1 Tax=Linnemannia gamsii TaxID=64522 RepID=A0ABQ7JKD4_9FUNG|nr:hypothetical protein BGZ96_002733 [Linnemannia gamsii]